MRIAGVQVSKYRRIEMTCPACGRSTVYSYAPRAIPSPDLYGVAQRIAGNTGWVVDCDQCPPWMPMATGSTEEEAIEAFKKRAQNA